MKFLNFEKFNFIPMSNLPNDNISNLNNLNSKINKKAISKINK